MKLNYAPQAGLRRGPPEHRRQKFAFWAGILILVLFELVLMAKSWSPESAASIFSYDGDRDRAALGQAPTADEQDQAALK